MINSCKLRPCSNAETPPYMTPCCVLSIANENKTQANNNVPTFCTLLTFPIVCEKFGTNCCRTFQCESGSVRSSLCCSMRFMPPSLRDIALRMIVALGGHMMWQHWFGTLFLFGFKRIVRAFRCPVPHRFSESLGEPLSPVDS